MVDTHATIEHERIKEWAKERDARPAALKGTGEPSVIQLDFPFGGAVEDLEIIAWDDWLDVFDNRGLAFVYQEETSTGERSNFHQLVSRGSVEKRLGRT